jgi:DNA-binding ferritin-like protein (Dps family)
MVDNSISSTPIVNDNIYEVLPSFLRIVTSHFHDKRERDVVLFACMAILSGIFSTVSGKYMNSRSFCNLFFLIVAPPASLKSSMLYGRSLADAIQDRYIKENQTIQKKYNAEMFLWKKNKKAQLNAPLPVKPKLPVLLLPGNSTASAIYKKLHESDGIGIICESEADTLSNALHNDMGNFSDLLRKVFHHEPISVSRSTDDLFVEVKEPKVSALLSGTPNQVPGLIRSAEDGLFSRFSFYLYSSPLEWTNPMPCDSCVDLKSFFADMSIRVLAMKEKMSKRNWEFKLTEEQFNKLSHNFKIKIEDIKRFEGHSAASVVFRLGLISFRIAMLLSILQLFSSGDSKENDLEEIICKDLDFQTALNITDVLFEHSMLMFSILPKNNSSNLKSRRLYEELPNEAFNREQANSIGERINIRERTIGNYLSNLVNSGLLTKIKHGLYQKVVE